MRAGSKMRRSIPGSIWFDLALALAAGLLWALMVLGPAPLDPRNIGWLSVDPAYHYIGWELFRQDPALHWPLTYTGRLGYPAGESVALTDLNPLLALVLKLLSPLLPEPMQYFGIEAVLACSLQFFFAMRIFRLIAGGRLPEITLASAFFLLAPPLTYRLAEHYSLSNQWLLMAALLVFLREQLAPAAGLRRFVVAAALLSAVAVGVNPYLAFQAVLVLTAAVVSLVWQRRMKFPRAAGIMALLSGICLSVAWATGLLIRGGRGYASGGYRDLSMNLLAPFDPRGWASLSMLRFPSASPGQYEGYNYLGAGVLALGFLVAMTALAGMRRWRKPDWRWIVPLAGCCLLLTLMALSTRITLGRWTVLDLDSGERLSAYFAPLRASGRLFWLPYYALLTAVMAGVLILFGRLQATLLLAAFLAVQVADVNSLRHWVHTTANSRHPSPLRSPVWRSLGAAHRNLMVLPPWQCAANASPGGPEGYRIFGFLAVSQKMSINSYQSARYTGAARDFHCSQSPEALGERPLSPDSVYVVTAQVAGAIAKGATGPGKCHDLDGFIVCSAATDFGLSPVLMTDQQRLEHAIANPGFEDGDSNPWTPVWELQAKATREAAHSGSYSLAESGSPGTMYQDVNGLEPGATYRISAWVSGRPGSPGRAQITVFNPSDNTAVSSPVVECAADWQPLSVSVAAGKEGAIRIHLVHLPDAGTIYWDDVSIAK